MARHLAQLNRQAILDAASALIGRDNLAALSMRRLQARSSSGHVALPLHPEPGAPDRQCRGPGRRRALRRTEVLLLPTGGRQNYLRRLAYGLRRMALAHPHLFPRHPAAPWVHHR